MPIVATVGGNVIPPWLEEAYKKIYERSAALNMEKFVPYAKPRIAEFPPEIQEAQHIGQQLRTYEPYIQQATEFARKAQEEFPQAYERYMNPFQQGVLDVLQNRAHRALQEQFLPALESRFIAAGQHGGGRHQELALRTTRDVQEALLNEQRQALSQGYDQASRQHQADKARQLASVEAITGIGRQQQAGRLGDIATLQELGQQKQNLEQQRLNTGYQDYLREMYHPQEQLAQHSAAVSGIQSPTQSFHAQYSSPQAQPQVNTIGQVGGLAASLYGAKKAFGYGKGGSVKKHKSPFKRGYT